MVQIDPFYFIIKNQQKEVKVLIALCIKKKKKLSDYVQSVAILANPKSLNSFLYDLLLSLISFEHFIFVN